MLSLSNSIQNSRFGKWLNVGKRSEAQRGKNYIKHKPKIYFLIQELDQPMRSTKPRREMNVRPKTVILTFLQTMVLREINFWPFFYAKNVKSWIDEIFLGLFYHFTKYNIFKVSKFQDFPVSEIFREIKCQICHFFTSLEPLDFDFHQFLHFFERLKLTKLTQFRAPKMAKTAVLEGLDSPKSEWQKNPEISSMCFPHFTSQFSKTTTYFSLQDVANINFRLFFRSLANVMMY